MVRSAVLTYDGTRLHNGGAHVIRAKSAEAGGLALEKFRLKCTDALAPDLVRVAFAIRKNTESSLLQLTTSA